MNIEATSKRIEQAVGNMLEVLKTSYEKVKEGSKPSLKPGETESQELVCFIELKKKPVLNLLKEEILVLF